MRSLFLSGSALAVLAACTTTGVPDQTETVAVVEPPADTREVVTVSRDDWGEFGLDLASMKPGVDPGDDFFQYANGAWYDEFEIPADRTSYSSFTLLREKSEQRVRFIIDDLAAAEPDPTTLEGKIAAYYNAYLDTDAIEAKGLAPAQPYLDRIASVETREDLAKLFATPGFTSPVSGFVDVDSKNTDSYIFYITQAGLGLPDRDHYLEDNEKNLEYREAYKAYLALLLDEAGYPEPAQWAEAVYALETKIAKAHWDRTVSRNRNLTYNKLSKAELIALEPDFPMATVLETLGIDAEDAFVVRQLAPTPQEISDYGLTSEQLADISGGGIVGLLDLMANEPLDTWKAYSAAHFLSNRSDVLPAKIDEATFALYGKLLNGQEEQRERWKRGVQSVEGALGEGVGKVYAARYFPPENKAAMDDLVENLRKAMADNLHEITWMSDATKPEAFDKLEKFTPKIGYTEKFETYDDFSVSADAFENDMEANRWAFEDMISNLGGPIDKTEWFMLPQTVNAYYSPNRNEIVFPAAILQPPFFNISADPAINYGAIGGVIGHEMGHGFDDQGAKSDGDGVLRNWWTPEDEAAFKALTDALVGQYNAYCPIDEGETCVNGRLTLGENIGDLGGLSMAYKAYKMSLDENGDGIISEEEEAPVLGGMTGDQRFFMSWAQVWRTKYRDDALRQRILTDPHSPPVYRVNGVVRNLDEWYEAFGVTPDDELYLPPEERIRIW
ncbi:M13 family metallopeptidase [Henriciella pelagia]|jgi:putative endopeptidase|uniref:Peptidase M13 n=1 Tax=Henriciella pelagia TaxID=1977912 RepID=A0ABQ1JXA1_9PROT|nr:M13 family metallopeptidase [Henriciella pelagia]GGB77146.1 peptidase M13 [Henriciella pelagia]